MAKFSTGARELDVTNREEDRPEVVAFPPFIYLAFLLMGFAMDYFRPVTVVPASVQYIAGFSIIALAGVIIVPAVLQFRRASTSFSDFAPATQLVTRGPYRLSRNPSYVALSLLYVGIGVAADNLWIVAGLIPILIVMHYGVIVREEQYLERTFGEEYLQYKASVRRWV